MRALHRLSALSVAKIKEPGRYPDGGNLWLQVAPTADGKGVSKSWLIRYTVDARQRQMGIGATHTVTLAMAREKATECRRLLQEGKDPIEDRDRTLSEQRAEAAKSKTFGQCAEDYIAAHASSWRSGKHADQWTATLKTYAFAIVGDLPVSSIENAHVLKVLEPIWSEKPETAGRVRGRMELILDWAKARGYRQGENPARWRGHLDKQLPPKTRVRKVRHHPSVAIADMPAFMTELRSKDSVSARALEFVILTAVRSGEVRNAVWPEFDLKGRVWSIPGERMKSGRPHRVPLSDAAIALLESLPRESDLVFIGGRAGKPLSDMALSQLMRGMNRTEVPHGFRSTFRDWISEQTNFPRDVAEAALAHINKDKTEAAYARGDLFEKRRRMMEAWARFCAKPAPSSEDNVTPLRRETA